MAVCTTHTQTCIGVHEKTYTQIFNSLIPERSHLLSCILLLILNDMVGWHYCILLTVELHKYSICKLLTPLKLWWHHKRFQLCKPTSQKIQFAMQWCPISCDDFLLRLKLYKITIKIPLAWLWHPKSCDDIIKDSNHTKLHQKGFHWQCNNILKIPLAMQWHLKRFYERIFSSNTTHK